MSTKFFNAVCLALMLGLSTCKGAINPAYASSDPGKDAFNEFTLMYTGRKLCHFEFPTEVENTVIDNALQYGTSDELVAYAHEEASKLIVALPLMGLSIREFCSLLYVDLKKTYG